MNVFNYAKNYLTKYLHAFISSSINRSFVFFSLAQALNAITNFTLVALYTKKLAPNDFGKINLIWIFVMVMSILIDGRLNTSFCIKYYKANHDEKTRNIYTIAVYYLSLFSIFYVILSLFPHLVPWILKTDISSSNVYITLLLVLVMVLSNFFNSYLVASQKSLQYFLTVIIFNLLLLLSSFIQLFYLNKNYNAYLISYLMSYSMISLLGFRYFLFNYPPSRDVNISLSNLKSLLKISLPLIPDALLLMLLTWSGRYILNLNHGLVAVGVFSVGFSFSNIFNSFIVSPFGQAIYPVLLERYAKDRCGYRDLLKNVFKAYWMIMFTLVIGYFVVLKDIFRLVVGPGYYDGYNIIGIIVVGSIIWGCGGLISATLAMMERTSKMFLFTFISFVVNIIINTILVPLIGIYGSAVAILAGYLCQFVCMLFYTQKLEKIDYDYVFFGLNIVVFVFLLTLSIMSSIFIENKAINIFLRFGIFISYCAIAIKFFKVTEIYQSLLAVRKVNY